MGISGGLMEVTILYPPVTRDTFSGRQIGRNGPRLCRRLLNALLLASLYWVCAGLAAQELENFLPESQIETYRVAIEDIESAHGPYAIELVDLYHGYGQALMDNGELEAALDAFQQTTLVARVNHGPHSLDQANYLYSIAKVESLLGNLEPSVRVLEYVYQIHARKYGENDPAMLPVVEQLSAWYEKETPLAAVPNRSTDYQNQSFLASRISELTVAQHGLGSIEAAEQYRKQGQLHFRAIFYMFRTGEPPIPELTINGGPSNNQWVVERSISNHYQAGERAFYQAAEAWRHNPEASSLEVAEAIAQLGDWYLVLEQYRTASKQYKRAYDVIAANGSNTALAEEYFGTPSPLRFLRTDEAFVRNLDPTSAAHGFEVVMTVSRNGRLSDIQLRNVPEHESTEDIQTVTRRLERTRFRPALSGGQSITKENYIWKPPPVGPQIASREGE